MDLITGRGSFFYGTTSRKAPGPHKLSYLMDCEDLGTKQPEHTGNFTFFYWFYARSAHTECITGMSYRTSETTPQVSTELILRAVTNKLPDKFNFGAYRTSH
jgi:hypothetical protein